MADERERVRVLVQAVQDALTAAHKAYDSARMSGVSCGELTVKRDEFTVELRWPGCARGTSFRLSVTATLEEQSSPGALSVGEPAPPSGQDAGATPAAEAPGPLGQEK